MVTAPLVRRIFSLSGLDRVISIYPFLEAAMAGAASAARPPLTLVSSPARDSGRQANGQPPDAPSEGRAAARGRGRPAGQPSASDTAITPAVIWEMVEAFHDGVALADGHSAITLASRRLEDMFGYRHGELAGSSIERLVPPDLQTAHRGHQASYACAPVTQPTGAGARLAGLRKDGTTFPAEISLSPLATRTGQFTVAVVRDITRARQLEEPAGLATAAAAEDEALRHRELLNTIVTRLFNAGLTLQSAASQTPGPAADAIDDTTAQLDDIIRVIRDTMLTSGTTEPGA